MIMMKVFCVSNLDLLLSFGFCFWSTFSSFDDYFLLYLSTYVPKEFGVSSNYCSCRMNEIFFHIETKSPQLSGYGRALTHNSTTSEIPIKYHSIVYHSHNNVTTRPLNEDYPHPTAQHRSGTSTQKKDPTRFHSLKKLVSSIVMYTLDTDINYRIIQMS